MDSNKWSVRQLFGLFDQNQDGLIDAQDIVAVCTLPNTPVSKVIDFVLRLYASLLNFV